MTTAYKFLDKGLKSNYDGSSWTVGEWRHEKKPTEACVGLNASRFIPDALRYVQGTILAKVEYKGAVIDSGDKVTCESMRIIKTWPWGKRESVGLAIFAAESVLHVFERKYPDDKRPRQTIEAARAWLEGTGTADAAYAAARAAYAADAANAANAAYAAAYAADAANAAARAANAAAYATDVSDYAGTKAQIHRLVLQMIEEAQNETNS